MDKSKQLLIDALDKLEAMVSREQCSIKYALTMAAIDGANYMKEEMIRVNAEPDVGDLDVGE